MAGPTRPTPGNKQEALNFAYMYGYPLLEYGRFIAHMPNATTNKLSHLRKLATHRDRQVVRPNSDTIYSSIFTDLSSNDLELEIPAIPNRYWCYSFYDMYANNTVNISSLQDHQPGKYLIRYTDKDFGLHLSSSDSGYKGYANMPTPYGISISRFATDQSASDQAMVNEYQSQVGLKCIPRAESIAPPFQLSIFTEPQHGASKTVSRVEAVLRLTAKLSPYNLSPVLGDRQWIAAALKESGIENGNFVCPEGVDMSCVYGAAQSQVQALIDTDSLSHGNGWASPYPEYLGNYGSHYVARFSTARRGYLAITKEQAIYPSLPRVLELGPDEAILIRFSRRPVLVKTGFWSLTAYDEEQYLVPNDLNRYCLGDRDNLTFPDGTPLSDKSKDGEFCILLQAADLKPPQKWINNWLPSPAGGGKASITLRWYGAKDEMMTQAYEYPRMEYIKAVTETANSRL
ncbi:hypothetical protein AJ78_07427 [Emergomyces pasteurianus Ep9510]|uniref:DUF1254 domain-containing protein n=1 Tax=Emergomyces pasteurianus Ep9510 TaxID=1447872 RepID=A0A1J9P5B5_9EURO|nr:hypothetical protein AJ78_07427 [Emergomyces pasteurianus Ep9510]